jgi:TPR repeat protein/tRNA A-37 threonylcarbamoyl transferase component Bud32
MGVVYEGEHTTIGRKAAIKMLHPEFSHHPEIVQRFFNEARASTLVKHRGIVDVLDFGTHTNGSAYIVMELLEGESLAARLRRDRVLDLESVVTITSGIASALRAAHAKGIVHRDLKPDNVFLVTDEELPAGFFVKVLDFGIAKLALDGATRGMTRTGHVMGTPSYMSPEQCRGAGEVDQRSDVYSLGCILFEMTCGRPPFTGSGPGDVLASHLREPAPRARSIVSSIPKKLDALIARCLEKMPAARPESMDALLAELDEIVPTSKPARAKRAATPRPPEATPTPTATPQPQPTPVPVAPPMADTLTPVPVPTPTPAPRPRSRRKLYVATVVIAAGATLAIAIAVSRPKGTGSETTKPTAAPAPAPVLAADRCEAGDVAACVEAIGYETDRARLLVLKDKACVGGHSATCMDLGRTYVEAKNTSLAVDYFRRGCEAGTVADCEEAARVSYEHDPAATVSMWSRACDLAPQTPYYCLNSGVAHENGMGVAKDGAAALALYDKGCSHGELHACFHVGRMLFLGWGGTTRLPQEAIGLWEKSCDGGVALSCAALAQALESGQGVAKDGKRARALLLRACETLQDLAACHNLAVLESASDRDAAYARLKALCDKDFALGCLHAAEMEETVWGRRSEAKQNREKACKLDSRLCK